KVGEFSRLKSTELSIELRDARCAACRGHERLHRRQAGLDHPLELGVLEVALPSSHLRAGLGSHADRDARIRQNLEIAAGLLECLLDALGFRAVSCCLL